jgi:hypothetical protein
MPVNSTPTGSETEGEPGKLSEHESPCPKSGKGLDDILLEHISRKVKDG